MSDTGTNDPQDQMHASGATDTTSETPVVTPQQLLDLVITGSDEDISRSATKTVVQIASQEALTSYNVILLYDEHAPIGPYHANRIYEAIGQGGGEKDILLLVHSNGGSIEPAYLLSKTCKRLAKNRFLVAIPRRAKSAATLIALGADEIHMGLISELGPIDPQVGDDRTGVYPALALGNALDELARLCDKYPNSSPMLSAYLSQNLDLRVLGYLTRVGKTASQYAVRLLGDKPLPQGRSASDLADHFVTYYQDHGFVIDIEEALELLGPNIVKVTTPEYLAANQIYSFLDFLARLLQMIKQSTFDYVGSISQGPNIHHRTAPAA